MLFNSIEFAFFLPIVFVLYWFVISKNLRLQNFFLLCASYFFYGWWDWRFLSLILFSTCVDFIIGLNLGKEISKEKKKALIWISVGINIGLLFLFKYYNFFAESFAQAFSLFGMSFNPARLNFILPIGISFYTFQTLSYSLDIYKKKLKPTTDFIEFATFVSFFPQLVAGPIERAVNLLPQFKRKRVFEYEKAADGMRQILWGLFQKIVIADNCAEYVSLIFNNSDDYSGSTLVLGVILFTFQVYGDFAGYSNIAIGTARLFGFNLMQNFATPYFSANMTEFWRRWHISLSTWIRDYVFTPLGFSLRRIDKRYKYIVVFIITFSLFGFWHGANWTFIIFGIIQGVILSYEYRTRRIRKKIKQSTNPQLYYVLSVFLTYSIWCISCVFFRAKSVAHALTYLSEIFSPTLFSIPAFLNSKALLITGGMIMGLILIEWFQQDKKHGLDFSIKQTSLLARWGIYICVYFAIVFFGNFTEQEFIYFQF